MTAVLALSLLLSASGPMDDISRPVASDLLPSVRDHMLDGAAKYLQLARKHGFDTTVDPMLILAYVRHESGFNPAVYNIGCRKRHPRTYTRRCTAGLAQLPPRYYHRKAGGYAELLDPDINLRLFAEVFRWLLELYGSERLALTAATWGVGRVERGMHVPVRSLIYVNSVLALRDIYRRRLSARLEY